MEKPISVAPTAPVSTGCHPEAVRFSDLGGRKVVADFSGGTLSSDGGVPFLRQLDAGLGLTRKLAACFRDQRDQRFVDHSRQVDGVRPLVATAVRDLNTL